LAEAREWLSLFGPDGKIKKIWPKVKVAEHWEEVLAAL
jgi:peroxiredoxin